MPAIAAPLQASDRSMGSSRMLNDIWDTPEVLRALLKSHIKGNSVTIPALMKPIGKPDKFGGKTPLEVMAACSQGKGNFQNKFTILGCGTSWHAALVGEYLIELIARIPVEVQYASEYRYRKSLVRAGDVVILVSNSGETSDAVESLRLVQRLGKEALSVAIVNQVDSTLARESDVALCVTAGKEDGVASTKAFSATVAMFTLLAIQLGEACGTLSEGDKAALIEKFEALPSIVQEVLDRQAKPLRRQQDPNGADHSLEIGECILWDMSCQNVLANNFIFLGRGLCFPIALEGAMKCKEIAYIHAEGYPAAEMKHGPIALIDQFMPVVVIAPRSDPCYEKIKSNIEEVRARSGSVIAITEDDNNELEDICEYVIRVPSTHEYLMPLVSVIPLQLLSYMMGILRGNEVDNPRGLVKACTQNELDASVFVPPPRS